MVREPANVNDSLRERETQSRKTNARDPLGRDGINTGRELSTRESSHSRREAATIDTTPFARDRLTGENPSYAVNRSARTTNAAIKSPSKERHSTSSTAPSTNAAQSRLPHHPSAASSSRMDSPLRSPKPALSLQKPNMNLVKLRSPVPSTSTTSTKTTICASSKTPLAMNKVVPLATSSHHVTQTKKDLPPEVPRSSYDFDVSSDSSQEPRSGVKNPDIRSINYLCNYT